MIVFELGCARGHRFEGWFASSEDFTRQSERALVRCPICDDETVAIVPSAKVRVGKNDEARAPDRAPASPAAPASESAAGGVVAGISPELLRKLREVVKATEDVGGRFPEEARRIHYDEAPARAIRGQASREEAAALSEEGIDFAWLPPFLTHDPH
jgi:hypothetical protein